MMLLTRPKSMLSGSARVYRSANRNRGHPPVLRGRYPDLADAPGLVGVSTWLELSISARVPVRQ